VAAGARHAFQALWELEMPDERLQEVAALFGFAHADQIINELADGNLNTFEKQAAWYASFLERIRQ
jgi:hypothetical protein